jgi:hypothetical protein
MSEVYNSIPTLCTVNHCRGGPRIFRTSVKIFLADGALSALGVVSTGRGRLKAGGGGELALNNFYADSPPLYF